MKILIFAFSLLCVSAVSQAADDSYNLACSMSKGTLTFDVNTTVSPGGIHTKHTTAVVYKNLQGEKSDAQISWQGMSPANGKNFFAVELRFENGDYATMSLGKRALRENGPVYEDNITFDGGLHYQNLDCKQVR